MKTILKKTSGILLAICMLATMFTCLIGIQVSAADADMLSFDGTNAYGVVAYTTSWTDVPVGDYRFEMDCKITSGTPVCYPCARVWNSAESTANFSNRSYTYDAVNYKYTVTFTITETFNNFSMYIGNYDGALDGSGDAVFSCANPKLYDIDSLGNATQNTTLIQYDFNTYTNTKDISSSTTHKWRRLSSAGVTRSSIPDGFFDPYVEPVPEYVHFEPNRNNYSRMIYLLGYSALDAGDYRFQMDCKIFSGTPHISVGNRDSNTYPQFDKQTNYTATYDAENYKYTITFTLTEDLTGSECMGILIGNYGDDGDFVCANPTFYELDGSGDPTGDNLINTFATQFYNSSLATGKWYRAGYYTCTTLPEHYFDKESAANYALYFPKADEDHYQVVVYKDTGIYVAANSVYRLVMDVNNTSAVEVEPTVQMRTGSSIGDSYTGTLISTNGYERVYEFTVTSAATGIGLFFGNYAKGTDLDVAFRKLRLYKWENGAYAGASMVAPLNSANFDKHDWTGTRANALNGKWTPLNCNGTLLKYGVDDKSHFPKEKMVHFPAGYDNYHVLAYKGGAIAAGTYRFTMDECAVGGIKSYVNLYVNSGFTTSVTKVDGSDVLDQTSRTVEFELYNSKDSFLLMIGNYGKGTAMNTYMKNAALYKIEGGVPVGDNLITTFMNYNLNFVTDGSRANAATNKWTSINWADGYINSGDIDEDCFVPAYLGGDYNNDGVADAYDLVIYKNVRMGDSVTCLSLDCDASGNVTNDDHIKLIKDILG